MAANSEQSSAEESVYVQLCMSALNIKSCLTSCWKVSQQKMERDQQCVCVREHLHMGGYKRTSDLLLSAKYIRLDTSLVLIWLFKDVSFELEE